MDNFQTTNPAPAEKGSSREKGIPNIKPILGQWEEGLTGGGPNAARVMDSGGGVTIETETEKGTGRLITDVEIRNERRMVACTKRKRSQVIEAEKMVRLRGKALSHVTEGTLVSIKMDPRDAKKARGLLGIVYDTSGNRAVGIKVDIAWDHHIRYYEK